MIKKYWKWIVGILGGIAAIFLTFFSGGIFVICLSGVCIPIALTFWGILTGIGSICVVLYATVIKKIKRIIK